MIALVTAARAADVDLEPLRRAFLARGVTAEIVAWDDRATDWARFDAVILRSTWDYPGRLDEFLAWLGAVDRSTRVHNAAEAVRWNSDKHYLADLAGFGVPIVPSTFVDVGAPCPGLPDAIDTWVVKPTVGASASGARRCTAGEVVPHVEVLHAAGHAAIVQPYLELIDEHAETSLVFLGDGGGLVFDHAVRRGAVLAPGAPGPDPSTEAVARCVPSAAELALAELVLGCRRVAEFGPLAYARVDVVPTPDGPVLMELELIEPSLYLGHDDDAVERAAAAWARLLGNLRSAQ